VAPDLLALFADARQAKGSVSESSSAGVDDDRQPVVGEEHRAAGSDACPAAGFERSGALFARLIGWAASEQVLGFETSCVNP